MESDEPMTLRDIHLAETRSVILRAALDEIEDHGLLAARMGKIAKRAGVSRPTLYSHFPQKEDFLVEAERRSRVRARELLEGKKIDEGALPLVHALVDVIFDGARKSTPRVRRELYAWVIREPSELNFVSDPLYGPLAEELETAQKRGEIPKHRKPSELTRLLANTLFGFLALENRSEAKRRRDAHETLEMIVITERS